jgi:uncharacterized protein (TIGR00730 family)
MSATAPVVCVYCGSRPGLKASYTQAARELGAEIGRRGWAMVYGGGNVGLMGEVADTAMAAGARVTGIIPESLSAREVAHRGLTELHVVADMHVRKRMMAERADMFLALPGGIGTLEELFEVWTWHQLGYHAKPIGLLNVDGYFDSLLQFMQVTTEQGFLSAQQHANLQVDTSVPTLLERLERLTSAEPCRADYSQA